MKKTQKEVILSVLKSGGKISPIEALNWFGCFRLASRINDLRNEGHEITTSRENGYAVYSLNN